MLEAGMELVCFVKIGILLRYFIGYRHLANEVRVTMQYYDELWNSSVDWVMMQSKKSPLSKALFRFLAI